MPLLKKKAVKERLGDCSDMHIHRLLNDPNYAHLNFPKPRYMQNRPYWEESAIDEFEKTLPDSPKDPPQIPPQVQRKGAA